MRVKTVSITYERKLNLGNYNSATLGLTLHADVESSEVFADVVNLLQTSARELVRNEYLRLKGVPPCSAEEGGTS